MKNNGISILINILELIWLEHQSLSANHRKIQHSPCSISMWKHWLNQFVFCSPMVDKNTKMYVSRATNGPHWNQVRVFCNKNNIISVSLFWPMIFFSAHFGYVCASHYSFNLFFWTHQKNTLMWFDRLCMMVRRRGTQTNGKQLNYNIRGMFTSIRIRTHNNLYGHYPSFLLLKFNLPWHKIRRYDHIIRTYGSIRTFNIMFLLLYFFGRASCGPCKL